MGNKESLKLFIFVGSIIILFVSALLMVVCIAFGAYALGQFLLWASVVLSIAFNTIAGFLGGQTDMQAEH